MIQKWLQGREVMITLGLLVLVFAAWYFYMHRPEAKGQFFVAEGYLVKDTPGLVPDTWHLIYEEPGFPGLSIPLVFDAASVCGSDDEFGPCTRLQKDDRVSIEGRLVDDRVRVTTLRFTNPAMRDIPVSLFYYNQQKDTDANGNVLCSEAGVQSVARVISPTQTPLADTIRLLLKGDITDAEEVAGISSEFPLLGVRLESAAIENGVATLTFSDEQGKTSGGSCRVSIVRAQIEATAKQFPSVKEVRIMPEELFQP